MIEEGKRKITTSSKGIECPYCNYVHTDIVNDEKFLIGDEMHINKENNILEHQANGICDGCGKEFEIVFVRYLYLATAEIA